jgi:RNA polymerase sigma-70 factor, ECF subfamily
MNTERQRDEKNFLTLYEDCADAVLRHCYYRVHDRELAKDLTQESFTRVWNALSGGTKIDNMKAFLFRTANNLIIDYYRKKKEASLDALAEEGFDPASSDHEHVEDLALAREALEAVSELEESYRNIILMRYVSDLSIGEIAEIIGESENVVSVRIHRGVKKLQRILAV